MFHGENEPLFNLGFYDDPDFDALIDEGNVLSGTIATPRRRSLSLPDACLLRTMRRSLSKTCLTRTSWPQDLKGFVNNAAYNNTVFWHEVTR